MFAIRDLYFKANVTMLNDNNSIFQDFASFQQSDWNYETKIIHRVLITKYCNSRGRFRVVLFARLGTGCEGRVSEFLRGSERVCIVNN